jgi:hypothetical protein
MMYFSLKDLRFKHEAFRISAHFTAATIAFMLAFLAFSGDGVGYCFSGLG